MWWVGDHGIVTGLSSKHDMLGMGYTRENLEKLCDECYIVLEYLKVYSSIIHPSSNVNLDPRNNNENLQSSPLKRLPGRPKKNKRNEEGEPIGRKRSTTMMYDNCKGFGHNQRISQRALVAKKFELCSSFIYLKHKISYSIIL